ncbi:MAG TPA: DUF1109 domain-containing protein [Aliidongia sp.]|nr:DUF1109 domain-containing protein [Aliidongia sp.]
MSDTTDLIAVLARDAAPVRPLRSPLLRAIGWLLFATLVIGGLVMDHGMRHDIALRFGQSRFMIEWLGSVSTAILAALAAFYLSVPGRSSAWTLLPIPGLVLWSLGTGYGCYSDWLRLGPDGLALGTSWDCLRFIALTTVPLSAMLLFLLRYTAPIRPIPTTILATLSVAALAAAGQSLMHGLDTTIMVLAWHVGTTSVLLLAARFAGPRLLDRFYRPSAAGRI